MINVKDRLDATDFFFEYTGVILTLTSRNVPWFYYRNFAIKNQTELFEWL